MSDVLARIVERKRREVASRIGSVIRCEPTRRSLGRALSRPGARFIMEVKRKSPSGHLARHSLDAAVAAYAPFADAISVLVDGEDFGGSLDDLAKVRARFDGPILAKEFIVDPVQVAELRAAGADAILVMMSVLGDAAARAVIDSARLLGMDALVEVHDEAELSRALALGASIVGINNRDLRSLRVDLATTERLSPLVPDDVLVVAESGIGARADVLRLAPHADAFLVGSALMASDNIARAARPLVFGEVKLCGLTRAEDLREVAAAGATHAGFIFHPASPRRLSVDEARPLVAAAREGQLVCVGVFAGDDPAMEAIARDLALDFVQVHGAVRPGFDVCPVIAVRAVRDGKLDPPIAGAERVLIDHKDGGSGEAFDWSILADDPDLPRAFIAGGITPANAADAAATGAAGLDLSSGVECAPGIKDAAKLAALFDALRPVARTDR